MLDYWKLWIYDQPTIERIMKYPLTHHRTTIDEHGVLKNIKGKYKGWKIETIHYPKYCLQISGSVHQYWNGGTNENDFVFADVIKATKDFCSLFELNPGLAFVKNLEVGVNLQLDIDASELMFQILCYNYSLPSHPYSIRPNRYFIEFEQTDYYFKVYDKGKQYRGKRYRAKMPEVPNTLRLEYKFMNSRTLEFANVDTLEDLLEVQNLQVLGRKIVTLLEGLAFDDDTIVPEKLPKRAQKVYTVWKCYKEWQKVNGATTSTTRKQVTRFKKIVERYGQRKIYSYILEAVKDKISNYNLIKSVAEYHPNYSEITDTLEELEPLKKRVCVTCGKDISQQHRRSKYCSENYVGYEAAHKCRNAASNPRNNRLRKIARIISKGVLFDIEPYLKNSA